ncbi:MAG TPA: rod shape-determining protein MreC [Bdellovibrionales bacterium]|nr:rod shape-determining protein MreC [Bdellovibrionales bacterium]
MNFFAFDIRKALIVLIVIALPLLSINMKRSPGEEPWYRKPLTSTASLIQGGYSSFTSGVRGTTSMYLKLIGIKKHNLTLLKENEELRAKLGALTELTLENERLTKLLDFKRSTSMELLAAKVIAIDLSPDHYSIWINRGTKHGLRKHQGVITVEGVVGYVLRSESESSQVLVLSDRSAAIDAIVQRTRARGLISGKNQSTCRLRYLERADDVAAGDMIVTSGLQGYFPKGFPIGRLSSVRKTDFGISQEAEVTPVVNPANLEEVFVVLNAGHEDFNERFGDSDFGPPLLSKENPEPAAVVEPTTASAQGGSTL